MQNNCRKTACFIPYVVNLLLTSRFFLLSQCPSAKRCLQRDMMLSKVFVPKLSWWASTWINEAALYCSDSTLRNSRGLIYWRDQTTDTPYSFPNHFWRQRQTNLSPGLQFNLPSYITCVRCKNLAQFFDEVSNHLFKEHEINASCALAPWPTFLPG